MQSGSPAVAPASSVIGSHSSALVRSIGRGRQRLVVRRRSKRTAVAPLPFTLIVRASQLRTASRPFELSRSLATRAPLRAVPFLLSFLCSGRSKVREVARRRSTLPLRRLARTSIARSSRIELWSVARTLSFAFGLPCAALTPPPSASPMPAALRLPADLSALPPPPRRGTSGRGSYRMRSPERARKLARVPGRVALPVVVEVREDLVARRARRRSAGARCRARAARTCPAFRLLPAVEPRWSRTYVHEAVISRVWNGRSGSSPITSAASCSRSCEYTSFANQLGWRNSNAWRPGRSRSASRAPARRSSSRWKFPGSCHSTGPSLPAVTSGSIRSKKRSEYLGKSIRRLTWVV